MNLLLWFCAFHLFVQFGTATKTLGIECPPRWFNCQNGRCIFDGFRCDGEDDCGNQKDEENCFSDSFIAKAKPCPPGHFGCEGLCLPDKWRCDGYRDCLDGSDEKSCNHTQVQRNCDGFLCDNLKCIDDGWLCDGVDDCGDRSDERNCSTSSLGRNGSRSDCNEDDGLFQCSDGTCIGLRHVCDGTKDCPKGDDEGSHCSNRTCSSPSSIHCDFGCQVTPRGEQCYCDSGFRLQKDRKTCEDIDECVGGLPPGGCSHICKNSPGSYKCVCHEGFMLATDNKTCLALGDEPLMLFSDTKQIRGYWMDSESYFPVTNSFRQALGVDMYGPDKTIFWVDTGAAGSKIYSTEIDGVEKRPIISMGLQRPEDIAVDWMGRNIYVTDSGAKVIVACTMDGRNCLRLIADSIDRPRAITLDPLHGYMYWTDWGRPAGIFSAGMDGSNLTAIVTSDLYWPNGITYDWTTHHLFWTDAKMNRIEAMDLATHARRTVISETVHHPYALTLFEDNLYWSDWESYSLERCNKFTGRNQTVILREAGAHIVGLHIFNEHMTPSFSNPCWAHRCSHLCLIAPNDTHTCACPAHLTLGDNRQTCIPKKDPFLLVSILQERSVKKVFPEMIGGDVTIDIPVPSAVSVGELAYDWEADILFIFDDSELSILAINTTVLYDSRLVYMRTIISKHIKSARGLTYDPYTRNLFWLNVQEGSLEVATTDFRPPASSKRAVILRNLDRPSDLAMYPEESSIYIAILGMDPHILVADTDGRNPVTLVPSAALGLPVALFLDRNHGDLYWADARRGQIVRLELFAESSFSQRTKVVRDKAGHVMSLAMDNSTLYWTDMDSTYLYRASFNAPFEQPDIIPLPGEEDKSSLKNLHYVQPSYPSGPCLQNRGGCSDICLVGRNSRVTCACPVGTKLSSDGFNCETETKTCSESEWLCDSGLQCIEDIWRCDGTLDCEDQSDEKNCTDSCPNGDFRCANGRCILAVWRCDGMDDCGDASDERLCATSGCPADHFDCGSGRCIPYTWSCDGEKDCADGSDERACNQTCPQSSNDFKCHTGQCIPGNWKCDGQADCMDASDEMDCHIQSCTELQFRCRNGYCIDQDYVCDTESDCEDGSDEFNCNYPPISCLPEMISCRDQKNCIYATDICDGHIDCADEWDEANCTDFRCGTNEVPCHPGHANHSKCIPSAWLCDGENDCEDWSDENRAQCLRITTATNASSGDPCSGQDFMCESGECIPWSKVCDHKRHCLDASDEGGLCLSGCDHKGCSQVCRETPKGPQCQCKTGYVLSKDGLTCEDVNECLQDGLCSQYCENTKGGYKCSCTTGYRLASDHHRCKANGTEGHILYMLPNEIRSLGLNSHSVHSISDVRRPDIIGMDYDFRNALIFWTETGKGSVMAKSMTAKNITKIVAGLDRPAHLAWDWIGRNFYITNEASEIQVCEERGDFCTVILHANVPHISSFVLDSSSGYMFMSIWASGIGANSGRIERVDMDGGGRKILINDEVYWPSGLTVDQVLKRLYWVDTRRGEICYSDYNGRGRRSLLQYSISHPKSLAMFEDNLYWANYGSDSIMRCNKFTGGSRLIVHRGHVKAQVLRVAHRVHQLEGPSPCSNSSCHHICVIGPENTHQCKCQSGFELAADGVSCLLAASAEGLADLVSCDQIKCENGGFCRIDNGYVECICPKEFMGPYCQFSRLANSGRRSASFYVIIFLVFAVLLSMLVLFLHWYLRNYRVPRLGFPWNLRVPFPGRGRPDGREPLTQNMDSQNPDTPDDPSLRPSPIRFDNPLFPSK